MSKGKCITMSTLQNKVNLTVYANYIGPSVMTDANSEGFPICDERNTENDRCVIKIIGIHWPYLRSDENHQTMTDFPKNSNLDLS